MEMVGRNAAGMLLVINLWNSVATEVLFTHNMALHDDYHMYWTFDDEYITLKLVVNTTGWVGWGLSSKPVMEGADIVIGWVDSHGNNHFHDRYAEGRYLPSIDPQQDYNLLEMTEKAFTTAITFKRKLKTTDNRDMPITLDTMRVLWSWNNEDPGNENNIPMHGKRGSKSALLLDYGAIVAKPLPKQYNTFDILMKAHKIDQRQTTYWCSTFKVPEMGVKKQHVVRIDPIITKGNEYVVHHMLVYECPELQENDTNVEHECRNYAMPIPQCTELTLHAWAIGGSSFHYPSQAGFSLNSKGDPTHLLLEIHYDNADKKQGIIDSSGFRFYYTEELRNLDSGIISAGIIPLHLGNPLRYTQMIPQHQDSFTTYGFCSSKCFRPEGKTTIFAVLPHAHVQGRKINARLMNETTGEEVVTIIADSSYDFNFQEVRYLKDPIELLPGYRIDVECTYETNNRDSPVVNGLGTHQEMCLAFIYHYPKVSLKTCWSDSWNSNSYLVGKEFGWNVTRSGRIDSSFLVKKKDYIGEFFNAPLLDPNFWDLNGTSVKKMEQLGEENRYFYLCRYAEDRYYSGISVNAPRILLSEKSSDTTDNDSNSGGFSSKCSFIWVFFILCMLEMP